MANKSDRNVYVRDHGNGKGRWWGVFSGDDRRSLGLPSTATRAEALTRYVEIERGIASADQTADKKKRSLGSAFDDYIAWQKRRGRSESTLEIDRDKARHFVRVLGDGLALHSLTARAVADYITTREKEGAHARTIQRELVVLRGALKLALHEGRITVPIERIMPLGYAPEYIPRTRWLAQDEARRIFEELPDDRKGWFAFALATGARKSEIEKAELGDIREHEVFIRGTKTRTSADTVPITEIQRPWIVLAKKHANKEGPAFGVWTNVLRGLQHATAKLSTCAKCRAGTGPHCEGPNGNKLLRTSPDAKCPSCAKVPKLAHVSPNDLRRTLGMWLRDAGVEPHLIGKVLRHVDSRMAEKVYATGSKAGLHTLLAAQIAAGKTKPRLRAVK